MDSNTAVATALVAVTSHYGRQNALMVREMRLVWDAQILLRAH
jgi:hypothetical protein